MRAFFRNKERLPEAPRILTGMIEVPFVDRSGTIVRRETREAEYFIEPLQDGVAIEMARILRGTFVMGSVPRAGAPDELPCHHVNVPEFYLSRKELTQAQWRAVMGGLPPCRGKTMEHPVDRVSWHDAMSFCEKLSKLTGRAYRLPSEAEWEYACRAGTVADFSFGDMITTELANYVGKHRYKDGPEGEYRHGPLPPGSFHPNAFGLFDMHGNLDEWCADSWHENYDGAPSDGSAWLRGGTMEKAVRGGSWHDPPELLRSAARLKMSPGDGEDFMGLRIALSL